MPENKSGFIIPQTDGVLLKVRVIPRAKQDQTGEITEERLKIRLTAPPVDGKANQALCRFIAGTAGVPRSHISIVSGTHSRDKTILISQMTEKTFRQRLAMQQ